MPKSFRLNYWRGEVLDFEIVFPPSLLRLRLVQAIHDEFRNELEVLQPGFWTDSICYPRFQLYYEKLLHALEVRCPVEGIPSADRGRFFLTTGVKGGKSQLSEIQKLLDYEMVTEEPKGTSETDYRPSTGRIDLDLLVTMQLSGFSEIGWLAENYGTHEIGQLIQQYWDLKSDKKKVSEAQKEKDRALVRKAISQNASMAEKIKIGRDQAMQTLMLKTGTAAMEIAKEKDKDAAIRNSSSSEHQPTNNAPS